MKAFLSYPSERLTSARELYDLLRSIGVDPWFDKESLVGGQNWAREIENAQQAAELIFLICSSEIVSKSGVIQTEVRNALDLMRQKPLGHVFLVSLRTEETRLPRELAEHQYIDMFRPGWQLAVARSVRLRFQELGEVPPTKLTLFFDAYDRSGGLELRTFTREFLKFEASADFFVYRKGGEYWDYVSAEIVSDVMGAFYMAKALAVGQRPERLQNLNMHWLRRVTEHFCEGEFISLQFDVSQFVGGAHGTSGVYTKNFGGPELGKVELGDVFARSSEALKLFRDYCIHDMEAVVDIRDSPMNGGRASLIDRFQGGDSWKLFSQWAFNQEGIGVWLGVYSGLPTVFGLASVQIPWKFFRGKLDRGFAQTPLGKFFQSRIDATR